MAVLSRGHYSSAPGPLSVPLTITRLDSIEGAQSIELSQLQRKIFFPLILLLLLLFFVGGDTLLSSEQLQTGKYCQLL